MSEEERLRQRTERILGRPVTTWTIHYHAHTWRPAADVYETEDGYTVVVELAGMERGEISVSLVDNQLIVNGVRPNPAPRGTCHQMEIAHGEFRAEIVIAAAIDAEHISAAYADGFLVVTLPRARAHRIPVTATRRDTSSPAEAQPGEPNSEHDILD